MEGKTKKLFQSVPNNVRRGLWRLYIVVAVPWVAWFGIQLLNLLSTHYYWSGRDISHTFWMLVLVPVGMLIVYGIAAWVFCGFREVAPASEEKPAASADYKKALARAISQLPVNDHASREQLYERAEAAIAALAQDQLPTARIAAEKVLRKAVRAIEQEEQRIEQIQRKQEKGSTLLLVASMFVPGLWAIDFTSMSLFWVARRGREKQNEASRE